jgi:hypothetical protein
MAYLPTRPLNGYPDIFAPGLGTIERRNPLPVGKYSVTVFDKDMPAFQAWRTANKEVVKVTGSVYHAEVTNWFSANEPGWTMLTFLVKTPVRWEGPGFPDNIPPDKSDEDWLAQQTALPAAPKSLVDYGEQAILDPSKTVADAADSAVPWKWILVGTGVLAAVAFAYAAPKALASGLLSRRKHTPNRRRVSRR